MIEVKAATEEMLEAFYHPAPLPSFFAALIVFEDENMIALGGMFYHTEDTVVLFSDAPEGWIAKHPLVAVKITKTLLAFAAHNRLKVISFASEDIAKAEGFLEHFGFVKNGDCYEWFSEFYF